VNATVYELAISATDKARELHVVNDAVAEDSQLPFSEKQRLGNLIREKFCRINAAVAGPQKPRWS
jgi:hypothetical protein